MNNSFRCGSRLKALLPGLLLVVSGGVAADTPEWISQSNAEAERLLEVYARFYPEMSGEFGVPGLDTRVIDLGPALSERVEAAFRATARELEVRGTKARNSRVREDIEILRRNAVLRADVEKTDQLFLLPSYNVAEMAYTGVRALLTDKIARDRHPAAAVRLNRYAGLEEGYTPLAALAEARVRDKLGTLGLLYPYRLELEKQLADSALYLDGIEELLDQYKVRGANKALKQLRLQVAAYDDFLRRAVLPKSRANFRLPAELYAMRLRDVGVDIPPTALAARARTAFVEIRNQMIALAPLVAREQQLSATDYPSVIRELRSRQLAGDFTLALYRDRLAAIEAIIRRENIVTLPGRETVIRLATAAESASVPSPFMQPPPLVNNQGERGEFVLPVVPSTDTGATDDQRVTDFSYDAVTWTLAAHEARPGHDLQFTGMVENGISLARALFAFSSVNAEGWALYAEAEMQPYLPLDGQMIALQFRLLRAARAFLDPGLQSGEISLADARRVLTNDVAITGGFADQELERYTYRDPGQATSYFYGYQRLLELRAGTEIALGKTFDRRRFHDFVLAQGLLPPDQLAAAVQNEFVPAEQRRASSAATR